MMATGGLFCWIIGRLRLLLRSLSTALLSLLLWPSLLNGTITSLSFLFLFLFYYSPWTTCFILLPYIYLLLSDGIRPFTMPLMKLACTALERVPLTRPKIILHLVTKFHQDLLFCRAPGDCDLTLGIPERQAQKIDPLLKWVENEFGCKPVVYPSFFGGKQDDDLVNAIESMLKKTDNCELAAIDAIAAASHSLVIAIGILRGKLQIEEAVKLTRLEEDLQIERWGLVEGGHDIDIADLRAQISSAAVFFGLTRRY